MGNLDRTIRMLAALVILTLYFTGNISGVAAIVGLILPGILVLTSLISSCPLYLPFGISTQKKR